MQTPTAAPLDTVADAAGAPAAAPTLATSRSRVQTLAWCVTGVTLVAAVAIFVLSLVNLSASGVSLLSIDFVVQLVWGPLFAVYAVVGMAILARTPRHRVGWTLLAAGLVWSLAQLTYSYAILGIQAYPGSVPWPIIVLQIGCFYPIGLYLILDELLLIFPSGKLTSPWWNLARALGIFGAIGASLQVGLGSPVAMNGELGPIPNPFHLDGWLWAFFDYVGIGFYTIFIAGIPAAISMAWRLLRATGVERTQLKWIAYTTVFIALAYCLHFAAANLGWYATSAGPWIELIWGLALTSMAIFVGIAILRYRLFDIDVIINRTLVYIPLTACVVTFYVLLVNIFRPIVASALDVTGEGTIAPIVATGAVAIAFQPLRDRLQGGVNRLLYGERDNPVAVLGRLGSRLEATMTPGAAMPAVAQTVTEALKLPWGAVALMAAPGDEPRIVAASGDRPAGDIVRLPLIYQHEPVGELQVAPRSPGESFSTADWALLETMARQTAIAAYALHLNDDLRQARARLVTAREEERRRLRRDLHDGLGAQLAGLMMQAGAAGRLTGTNPGAAAAEMKSLQGELRAAIAEIRRLVHGLRPPALDELGLVPALRARVMRFHSDEVSRGLETGADGSRPLAVSFDAPASLPPLSAAAEVAIYRIVEEALTNIARHALASHAHVRLRVDAGSVALEIEDNGVGIDRDAPAGVGLRSMRERAGELEGTFTIATATGGGTSIRVCLPLATPEGPTP
jgi:signal transduction histidine kinase